MSNPDLNPSTAWIQMPSGKCVCPLNFQPDDFDIEDVAHSLGNMCRFGGKIREFYSVAQHSIFVASMLPPELKIYGLLHDAAEAYLQDIASPIKKFYWIAKDGLDEFADFKGYMQSFGDLESQIMYRISKRLGLDIQGFCHPLVKEIDLRALATEQAQLMGPQTKPWNLPYPPYATLLQKDRHRSKFEFLHMFHELMGC